MSDYNASIIARLEYEERVRSLVPVRDYDDRLKDDRSLSIYPLRSGIVDTAEENAEQPGLLYAVGSALVALGEKLRDQQHDPVTNGRANAGNSAI